MAEILIGAAAGLAVAAAGLLGYRRGLKDGKGQRGTRRVPDGGAEEQNALMKKYEAILDYDPYGEHV